MIEAEVDLTAIAANVREVAASTRAELMAVVKADAFGHGAVAVARAALAAGATWLGVTSVAEALALRAAGLTAPTLSWLHLPDADFAPLIRTGVDISVPTVTHLDAVVAGAHASGQPATIHLKVDTGLSRNGPAGGDWADLVAWAHKREAAGEVRVRGVWSHLASADLPGPGSVDRQVAAFEEALRQARAAGLRPGLAHLANSAAALCAPRTHYDLCRIGLALYGEQPVAGRRFALRPAMTLRSSVINVKRVPAGTGVSYRHEYVTARPTTLALVPAGYADGLPRATEGRAQVWLGGRRCPIVGRIAMDQCVVDAGDLPIGLREPVVLFGPGDHGEPTAAEWAGWAGTNPHEIFTGVGPRVARTHIHEPHDNNDIRRENRS
jgi:alanine racemase